MKTEIKKIPAKITKRKKNIAISDFSAIEDNPNAIQFIRKIGVRAGKAAAAEAMAAGLPRLIVKDNEILKVYPDGKEILVKGKKPIGGKYFVKYKTSTVFYATK
jgi:hypothetical protein